MEGIYLWIFLNERHTSAGLPYWEAFIGGFTEMEGIHWLIID